MLGVLEQPVDGRIRNDVWRCDIEMDEEQERALLNHLYPDTWDEEDMTFQKWLKSFLKEQREELTDEEKRSMLNWRRNVASNLRVITGNLCPKGRG